MIDITVKEIRRAAGGHLVSGREDFNVTGLSTDSRTVMPGELFIALRGPNFDGHDHVAEALEKGAAGAIVREGGVRANMPSEASIIAAEDTFEAMGRIAAWIRRKMDIPVICITGTTGKTTVKDILAHILSAKFKVLSSKKSYNNIVGLSLTLFGLDASYEVAVLEVGTNHPGEIPRLAYIAAPHMAIITNIGDGHLEAFVDREGVFLEKITLLDALPSTGVAFLNRDDVLLARTGVHDVTRKFFGMSPGSHFLISNTSRKDGGREFLVNGERYFIPMEGTHNIYNATAAIAAAQQFGLTPDEIRSSLGSVSMPGMRLERTEAGGISFINDSCNANPDSFESALEVLQDDPSGGMKGVVAGDMMELGERSEEFHKMIGKSIADRGLDFLIALGDRAWSMGMAALDAGMDEDAVLRAESHEHAAEMIQEMARPGAVVLLKGSRSTRMEEVLRCFTTSCTH